jgi:hypothetical protein
VKKLLLSALLLLPLATAVPAAAAAAPVPVPEAVPAPAFLVQEGGTCLAEAPAPELSALPEEGQAKPIFKATVAECIAFCGANPQTVRLCRLTGGRCGLNPDTNECGCWYP